VKYKTKIIPENGGYVGYALLNDEVVFTTNNHKDPVMASREISNYIASTPPIIVQKPTLRSASSNHLVPVRRSPVQQGPAPAQPVQGFAQPSPSAPRRCCGRG
jgi:hypothetical protein